MKIHETRQFQNRSLNMKNKKHKEKLTPNIATTNPRKESLFSEVQEKQHQINTYTQRRRSSLP